MLDRLSETLQNASAIVTYNGKSFDWPLLKTRFVLNRLPAPPVPAHIDLLHLVRRIYKRRIGELRLSVLEREVLGFAREGDIDGADIPPLYQRFLQTRALGLLVPVLEHNALDLISMVAAIALVSETAARPGERDLDNLSMAKLAWRKRDHDRVDAFTDSIAEHGTGDTRVEALILRLRRGRRTGTVRDAAAALAQCVQDEGRPSDIRAMAHLELSKAFEHDLHDFEAALWHARRAGDAEGSDAQVRRIARLESKLARIHEVRAHSPQRHPL